MRLKWIALSAAILVVVGGWTGGWFYLRSVVAAEIDGTIAEMARDGIAVDCPGRTITGWPFRMAVGCTNPSVALPDGSRIEAAALQALTVVNDPRLVIVAVEAPLSVKAPDGAAAEAAFTRLQSSIRFTDAGVGRVSVVVDALDAEGGRGGLALAGLAADGAELHIRPDPSLDDVDVALTLREAMPRIGGDPILPAPAGVGLAGTVNGVGALREAADPLRAFAAAGGSVDLDQAVLELGETRLDAAGTARIEADGALAATLTTTGKNVAWLGTAASEGKPMPPVLATLGSAFLLLGRPVEDGGRQIRIEVEGGRASANGLLLGDAPRLF